MRVLGIDPGLTRCGLGVVDGNVGRALTMVAVDTVRTPPDLPLAFARPVAPMRQDMDPPKDPSVQVRCVKDHGSVVFSIGSVNLAKDTAHLLPREEAEPFISSGVLVYME